MVWWLDGGWRRMAVAKAKVAAKSATDQISSCCCCPAGGDCTFIAFSRRCSSRHAISLLVVTCAYR